MDFKIKPSTLDPKSGRKLPINLNFKIILSGVGECGLKFGSTTFNIVQIITAFSARLVIYF